MICAGDVIDNPVTGVRMLFRKTAGETNGRAVVVETFVQPNGFMIPVHIHPAQEERFEILHGSVGFRLARERTIVGPGARLTAHAGVPHGFWNAGDEIAHLACELRPALQFESLIETMFGLAADGRTNSKGMPSLFRLAVIAHAHFDTVRMPFAPALIQRAGLALGAAAGRVLGYEPNYPPVPAAHTN